MTLDKLAPGESGIIAAVGSEGALRLRLLDMGLIPGTKVSVKKLAPLGDPMVLYVRGYELSLRKSDAMLISLREGGNDR